MIARQEKTQFNFAPLIVLVAATLLCLLPFAGKAFNIDEPLFIWAARHIQSHPFDFYGFRMNWYGTEMSAAEIIKNPPLASYYIALAASVGGWSETSLHLAFILAALGAVFGTYCLAHELTQHPLAATLMVLLTPGFVVSSATVMCDTMMLAFWVWAVYLWIKGMKCNSYGQLFISSLLIALCSLTKYFGMSLIPLLLVYSLATKRGERKHILMLLVPILVLILYQWGTWLLYGNGLLLNAAEYARTEKPHSLPTLFSSLVIGLSFLGGVLIPSLLLFPALWGRRVIVAALAAVPLLALGLANLSLPARPESTPWGYYCQLSIFVVAGIHLFALAVYDVWKDRSAESLLLFLWFTGTFIFASFVNWSINGRSMLPLVPVAGLLLVRGVSRQGCGLPEMLSLRSTPLALSLVCAWLISMLVAWSDYALAGTARQAADLIVAFSRTTDLPLLFQGHWGYQYYMESNGASAWDARKMYSRPFMIAVPENNTNQVPEAMKGVGAIPMRKLTLTPAKFLTNMNADLRAGFYSSAFGALPFAFGNVPAEKYEIVMLK